MSAAAAPRDDETLAAEFALGLLDDDERRAAQARVEAEPAFAQLHAEWQAHFATLLAGADEAPPASVWQGVAARLPANDDRVRHLRWWQAATAASLLAAAALGAMALRPRPLTTPPLPPARAPTALVALLTGAEGGAVAVAYDPAMKRLVTTPAGLKLGSRASELWVIPAGGKPIALGVIAAGATSATTAPTPAAVELAAGATLAVSVEPAGGSPTGQPTGPVILSGKINAA